MVIVSQGLLFMVPMFQDPLFQAHRADRPPYRALHSKALTSQISLTHWHVTFWDHTAQDFVVQDPSLQNCAPQISSIHGEDHLADNGWYIPARYPQGGRYRSLCGYNHLRLNEFQGVFCILMQVFCFILGLYLHIYSSVKYFFKTFQDHYTAFILLWLFCFIPGLLQIHHVHLQ